MLKAVIFDMDGVIIDSEPMHARAALLALQKYKAEITIDYVEGFIGSTTYYMCQRMVEDLQLQTTPEELLRTNEEMKRLLLSTEGHTVVPYVIDLIKDLYQHGIMLTIASSSSPEEIEEVMDSLEIRNYFRGFVSGVNVPNPKPAPDIFLEAAKRLEVSPEECLVIEDSYHGVTAANAAGVSCIGLVNPHSGNQDLSKAALLVEGFEEVDYSFIKHFYDEINTSNIILTTDRLLIRELTLSDIPDLFRIYRQPEIREFLDDFSDDLSVELDKHKAYIKYIYRFYGFGLWGVFIKDSETLIGRCGIELTTLGNDSVYEIGYLLNTEYQGIGYGVEFVEGVLKYSKNILNIQKIIAIIDKGNLKSIQLAERVGMRRLSEYSRNRRDCYVYEAI